MSLSSKKLNENIVDSISNLKEEFAAKKMNFQIAKNINFIDDTWDFSYMNTYKRESTAYKFNFTNVKREYINYLKFIILNEIAYGKNRIQTIHKMFDILKTISNELYKIGCIMPNMITQRLIIDYLNEKESECSHLYILRLIPELKKLIYTVGDILDFDINGIIEYINEREILLSKFKHDKSKNEYIPDEYLNKIVSLAIKDSKDNNLSKTYRIFVNLLIIIAETGMRIEELLLLEKNKLDSVKVSDKMVYYLRFISPKGSPSNNKFEETYCYLTELAALAYKTAEKISNEIINTLNADVNHKLYLEILKEKYSDVNIVEVNKDNIKELLGEKLFKDVKDEVNRYMFISDKTGKKLLHTSNLREYLKRFSIKNYDELMSVINEKNKDLISYFEIKSKTVFEKFYGRGKNKAISFEDIKGIKYPYVNFHRYRVTVCTKMHNKNIPLDFIRSHVNHIYEDMTCYYIKNEKMENDIEENIRIIKNMADENGYFNKENKIYDLSEIAQVDKKVDKINTFLKNRKLNINSDLNRIIKILGKTKSTISENEFGMCIRTILNGICKRKEYFSSAFDNYHIGLHLDTFRYIDLNYERFKQKKIIIEHNKKIVDLNKELSFELVREQKALKYFLNKTLLKEIYLLEREIEKLGLERVLNENKNLTFIINNIEPIKEDINKWIL